MSDEKSQQQTSTESTVAGAAKTGKAISNIAKGAAAGGAHGAAIEAGKSSAKWLIPLIAAVLLPLILVAMLPSIIFGSLLGDGTDSPNGISNDEVLVQNMTAINEGISSILSEGLTDVLERIDSDFASSGCDGKEINNPFGADVVFNANAFVSQYCAHKDTDIASISKEDKLDDGWYTITELEPAAGYSIKDPTSQQVYVEAGRGKVVTFENTPLSAIIVKKVDSSTGDPLQGAWFRVRFLGGTSGTGGTVIAERQTSSNGTFILTGLKAGTYVIEEISAPDGYVLSENDIQTVYLSGNEQDVITVTFGNEAKGIRVEMESDGRAEIYMSDGTMFRCDHFDASQLYGTNEKKEGVTSLHLQEELRYDQSHSMST